MKADLHADRPRRTRAGYAALLAGFLAVLGWLGLELMSGSLGAVSRRAPLRGQPTKFEPTTLEEIERVAVGKVSEHSPQVAGRAPADATQVSGRIVRSHDRAPIDEGSVGLYCRRDGLLVPEGLVALDEDGRFSGPSCPEGVCVRLRNAHHEQREPWTLHPGASKVFVAEVREQIIGIVRDPRGDPVEGARIDITALGDDPTAILPFVANSITSDDSGHSALAKVEPWPCDPCGVVAQRCGEVEEAPTAFADLVRAIVHADGFPIAVREIDLQVDEVLEIRLDPPRAPLVGTLRDPWGRPYTDAFVELQSDQRPFERHRAPVGEAGFEFRELGEGNYAITAIKDGIALAQQGGVGAGIAVALIGAWDARGVVVRARLVDEHGEGVSGGALQGGPWRTDERSDSDGWVTRGGVMPGTYRLQVVAPGRRRASHLLEIREAAKKLEVDVEIVVGERHEL